ncbi:helix-turn-helix domain-containing protein [Streptomyces sp. NPDC099050]|uniref:helix-turn-helix domain-containing protein n=1 Tax=Streptomyces sp. NPDC099050 TaxID=3366100 RepID=UPI0037F4B8C8
MSTEAMNWAMDDAPMPRTEKGKPDTTARHVLQVLAEHARSDGSNSHPSVLRVQYRSGYDRTTVQRAFRRLEKAGLIRKDGSVDGRTRWQLAMELVRPATDWKELEREEDEFRAAAAERKRRSRSKDVTDAESVTVTDGKGVTVTHSKSVTGDVTDSAPSRHALNASPSRTQRRPNHQQPSVQPKTYISPPAASSSASQQNHHLEAFGAFWSNYPLKKAREEAKKAWIAAIERGADPAVMVTGAQAYARERRDQDPQFTKHPATWLNKGCYDDEPSPAGQPSLHVVRGGQKHQPFQPNPKANYHKGFGS